MELLNIPYHRLNRHGRRSEIAINRKALHLDRVWKAKKQSEKVSESRRNALNLRLDRVRERTRLRKLSLKRL